jgi:hypothetical protein
MPTPVEKAILAARGPQKRISGRRVVLRRYVGGVEKTGYVEAATVGETTSQEFVTEEMAVTVRYRDYLIDVKDYIIDGEVTDPQPDDQIDETIGGLVVTFQVLPNSGEPNRYSDMTRTTWRLHTKEVKDL